MYDELIRRVAIPPTSINTWIELFPFLENHDWKYTFTLPNLITKETYLQSFQYKIITRTLNCNYSLFKWGIKTSPVCVYCCHNDTITHHLFECEKVQDFWRDVQSWIYDKLGVKFSLTVCEIIFGISGLDDFTRALNYIILFGKVYINKQRTSDTNLDLKEFISKLQDKVKVFFTCNQINQCKDDVSPLFKQLTRS